MRIKKRRHPRAFLAFARVSGRAASEYRDVPASNRTERARPTDRLDLAKTLKKSIIPLRDPDAPPSTSLWPPKYFVVEYKTRSAPKANGR